MLYKDTRVKCSLCVYRCNRTKTFFAYARSAHENTSKSRLIAQANSIKELLQLISPKIKTIYNSKYDSKKIAFVSIGDFEYYWRTRLKNTFNRRSVFPIGKVEIYVNFEYLL